MTPTRHQGAFAHAPSPTSRFHRAAAHLAALALLLVAAAAPAADEKILMPQGAFECRTVEPVIEHAKIVRAPTTAGLREFVEAKVASGACRVVQTDDVRITVVDVDRSCCALVQEKGKSDRWWTDAENVWGYFDTPKKLKEWKKP